MDILHKIELDNTTAALGYHHGFDIAPGEVFFEKEKEIISRLSPRKKSEWLASREILFLISKLPERIECLYDDFGKPYLIGVPRQISVSHSSAWAAAMISDRPCGIDIQVYSSTIERIAEKFLSPEEIIDARKIKNHLHYLHLLWGAKECMYKAYGRKKLEFRQHIRVLATDMHNGSGTGEIIYEGLHLRYEIHFRFLPEAAWVFCMLLDGDKPIPT